MLRHLLRLLFLATFAHAAFAAPWPERSSDLPSDPLLKTGTLPNGLRYVILPNSEPLGRVSLRFLVQAGSLHERDDERGLAHFVEHMVFRGTRRHPAGTMTAELQRLGIGFGPDNTAFTHYDHTIYHLELPDTTETTLRQGLGVFREYAEDVSFDAKLIDRERGVVLSEMNTRDTPSAQIAQANLEFLWPKSRYGSRLPIGTAEAIKGFRRQQFVDFYNAWYRPDRMAVVIVGEIRAADAERLIAEVLGPLTARGPARQDESAHTPASAAKPDIVIFSHPDLVGASCTFQHPFAETDWNDTHQRRVAELHRGLAFTMFQRRLATKSNATKAEFVDPSATVSRSLPHWGVASFTVSGTVANWKDFMSELEREHRSAFVHGFTATELRSAKTLFQTNLDDAVRTYPTRPSSWLADVLASSLEQGTVLATPESIRRDLQPELEAATLQQCIAAFRSTWTQEQPHVFIVTGPQFSVRPATIAQALNESRLTPVAAPAEAKATEFAYTHFGETAAPARVAHVTDLAVEQAEYPNGTRLNFKATAFEADTVQVYVRIGSGRLSQPESMPGLDYLANSIVSRGGLQRHTYEELQDLFSGHSIALNFYVDTDAFAFNARCSRRDLVFCLQVIAAHLTDSAYRPEAMREINASFGTMYNGLATAAGGPISVKSERILAGGDRRFGVPLSEELFARTIDEVKAWIEPEFKGGAIELSIVGDATWEEARDAVGSTLAALAKRSTPPSSRGSGQLRPVKPAKRAYAYSTSPQLHQVALARICPARDVTDVYRERRCRLLSLLIEDRLRMRLREELGAAYSSSAGYVQYEGFPEFGYFSIYAEVAPEHARQAAVIMRKELEALRKKKFTDDEFERARQPFLRARQDDLRSNAYWGYTVLRDAQQRPERLVAARNRSADTKAITRTEIERLAKRYLDPDASFEFVAFPAPSSPAGN